MRPRISGWSGGRCRLMRHTGTLARIRRTARSSTNCSGPASRRLWRSSQSTMDAVRAARDSEAMAQAAQREQALRLAQPAQGPRAERRRLLRHVARDRARENDRHLELAAQPLQTVHEIDRGSDDGEVKPARRADIAEADLARVQRDAVTGRVETHRPPRRAP